VRVKKELEAQKGIPADHVMAIYLGETPLEDGCALSGCTLVRLVLTESQIVVRTTAATGDCAVVVVTVSPFDLKANLKEREKGLPSCVQRLLFGGEEEAARRERRRRRRRRKRRARKTKALNNRELE